MRRVFIAYGHADAQFARDLATQLSERVTVSDLMGSVSSGESWGDRLREQLATADVMVVLVSRNALGSPWLEFELGAALGLGKRVLPVFLDDPRTLDADKLDYLLRDQQYMDVHGLPTHTAAERVGDLIAK